MRQSTVRTPLPSKYVFVGAKCDTPIPLSTLLHLDVLIQSSLDPAVTLIEYVPTIEIAGTTVLLDAVLLTKNGRRFAVELPESRPLRDVDSEGLVLMALSRLGAECLPFLAAEVQREPTFSSARAIWSHQRLAVAPQMRENILATIDRSGIPLYRLAEHMPLDTSILSAVCSLAC